MSDALSLYSNWLEIERLAKVAAGRAASENPLEDCAKFNQLSARTVLVLIHTIREMCDVLKQPELQSEWPEETR